MNVGKRPAQASKMKKAPESHKMKPLKGKWNKNKP
jgi:hypothetical protein